MSDLVADAHSDLLMELVHAEDALGERDPLATRWLPPLERGGVGLQVCALYADASAGPDAGLRTLLRQAQAFRTAVAADPGRAFAVATAADLERVGRGGVGLLLSLEGVAAFGEDGWLLDVLVALGVRMVSLTWNERNAFAGGCDHASGLTPLGERLVDRAVELGVVSTSPTPRRAPWTTRSRASATFRSSSATRRAARCTITGATWTTHGCARSPRPAACSG